jgi:hypothetical protein
VTWRESGDHVTCATRAGHGLATRRIRAHAEQRAKLDELGWKQLVVVKPMLKENKWIPHLRRLLGQPVV